MKNFLRKGKNLFLFILLWFTIITINLIFSSNIDNVDATIKVIIILLGFYLFYTLGQEKIKELK